MGFKEETWRDAYETFLDPSTLGEYITYHSGSDRLNGRRVRAVVQREPDEITVEAPNKTAIEVWVHRDDFLGSGRPKAVSDAVDVEPHPGDTPRRYQVEEVLSGEAGTWHLRCAGMGEV